MFKLCQLLQEKEKHVLYNIGKYIEEAMSLRKNQLYVLIR